MPGIEPIPSGDIYTIFEQTGFAAQRTGTVTGRRCDGAGGKVNTARIIAHTDHIIGSRYE